MGSKLPRRALAAVLLLTVWQTNHFSSAWSAQFFKQSPHRRVTRFSNVPNLGGFSQIIDTLKPNEIWNQLQTLDNLVNLLQKIQKLWSEFESPKVYTSGSNRTDHVSFLMKRMEKALQGGNVIVPGEFVELLPLEPVRNTSVERLMIEVLCGRTQWGMRSIFAEPGSGKSVASILAAYEVATRLTSSDVFVVLQNDMEERLKEFYLIEQMSSAADIATLFFSSLKNNGTRLTMILDNAMDGGVRDDVQKDRLKALARAATKYGHMILFTTQDKDAAQSIGKLNGVTTNIAKNQNFTAGAYRWNEEETLQLTKTFFPNKKPEELKEVVFGAEIPDSIGGWRPRDTEVFINTGEPPRLLQQQAGWQ